MNNRRKLSNTFRALIAAVSLYTTIQIFTYATPLPVHFKFRNGSSKSSLIQNDIVSKTFQTDDLLIKSPVKGSIKKIYTRRDSLLVPDRVMALIDLSGSQDNDEIKIIRSEVSGKIKKVFVQEGDEIEAGDQLFQIENHIESSE